MNKLYIPKEGSTSMVLVMAPVGSFYEDDKYKGISHFVEHLCFKGNKNRNVKQIAAAIDNIGGVLNAFTCEEMTCYWAKVSNRYVGLAKNVIGDLAFIPLFPTKEVEKERKVILQEYKMYEDDPKDAVYDLFNQTLYKKESGFYLPIIGTPETLQRIKQRELKEFHSKHYKDLTMIVVGNTLQEDNGRHINSGNGEFNLTVNPNTKFEYRKNITQANIIMGYHVQSPQPRWLETNYLLKLLSALYSDMSGRLFSIIREKYNLVYRIHFMYNIWRDNSITWKISLGLNAENIKKAEKFIIQELNRPITKKELESLKIKVLGTLDMSYDSSYYLATFLAYRLAKGQCYKDCFDIKKSRYVDFSVETVNKFIKSMNFKQYCMAGILPKGK